MTTIYERLKTFEESLGLPAGFIRELRNQSDDWSFTIKAHALVEAGLTQLLAHELGHPELETYLSRLNMGGHVGKLRLAEELKLLSTHEDSFISALGELRNRVVHNIRNVGLSLSAHFTAMEPSEFKRKRAALDLIFDEGDEQLIEVRGEKLTPAGLFKSEPKPIITGGLGLVLSAIHLRTMTAKWEIDARNEYNEMFRDFAISQLSERWGGGLHELANLRPKSE